MGMHREEIGRIEHRAGGGRGRGSTAPERDVGERASQERRVGEEALHRRGIWERKCHMIEERGRGAWERAPLWERVIGQGAAWERGVKEGAASERGVE